MAVEVFPPVPEVVLVGAVVAVVVKPLGDVPVPEGCVVVDDPVLPLVAATGETGTLVLVLPEEEVFPLWPPITPKPNSRASVSNAKAMIPPKIHQPGWHRGVSFFGSLSGPNFLVG